MSQASTWGVPTTDGGNNFTPEQVATRIDDSLDALLSAHAGSSRPSYAVAGTLWLDTTSAPWLLKQFDGTDDITLARINATDNTVEWVESAEQDLASASTCDLGSKTGRNLRITGTTTITSFGTAAAGVEKRLRFAGALTLTHNATSLILPGGANITTEAGAIADVRSEGSGNWRLVGYQDAVTAKLNKAQTFTAPQKADKAAIVHNTAWDGTAKSFFTVETDGSNVTVAAPSGLIEGQGYAFRITHTTAHATSWNSVFKGGIADILPAPVIGAVHYLGFEAVGGNLYLTGYSLNAAA